MKKIIGLIVCAGLLAGCLSAPRPVTTQKAAPATQAETPTATQTAPAVMETAAITPSAASMDSSPLFPGLDLVMEAELPAAAENALLYEVAPQMAATNRTVLAIASNLRLDKEVYLSNANPPNFWVFDGEKRYWKSGSGLSYDLYFVPPMLLPSADCAPPCVKDDAASRITQFLREHNQFNYEYRSQTSLYVARRVEFIQLVDKLPLISPLGPAITAQTDKDGELLWVGGREIELQPRRNAKLANANDTWQALQTGAAGVIFQEFSGGITQPRSWSRRYPTNVDLTAFGEAQVFKPTIAGSESLILMNNYIVRGSIKGLEQSARGGRIIQIWGRAHEDGPNGPEIELTGWQASVFPEQVIEGRLKRDGEKAYLAATDARYFLPDAPKEIVEDAWLTATGVIPDDPEPTLEWYSLRDGPAQRVRTGGPGFRPVSLEAQEAAAATTIPEKLDGATGVPQIIAHAYADGSSEVEVQFKLTGEDGKGTAIVRLDGEGLQGIDAFQNLPVRLWGKAGEAAGGLASINVERFEPVYPGLKVDAWLGMPEKAKALGKDVWLLTTPDGESFVLGSTLEGKDPPVEPALLRDPVIVEGVQIPGKNLLDFPIIDDLQIISGVGRNDMEGYQPVSAQPRVVTEPGAAGARRTARIESVELVYILTDTQGAPAKTLQAGMLAQPVWRFSGYLDDGSGQSGAYFEIYVQALLEV